MTYYTVVTYSVCLCNVLTCYLFLVQYFTENNNLMFVQYMT